MEMRRIDVQRIAAYGSKTVFVPTTGSGEGSGMAEQAGNALAVGFAAGMGSRQSRE